MAYPYPYSGPIAPYNNVPIEPQWYQPRRFQIAAISIGVTTTVTATANLDYVIGQEVRLLIPPLFGCRDLNESTGFVIAIPAANQVTLDIFSSGIQAFTIPVINTTQAQILAIGDANSGFINAQGRINQGTYIPGSFINISPN